MTAKVKTALSLNKHVPAGEINVDSEGDAVTLSGQVANDEIRTTAERVAADTPGVGEVRNRLNVMQPTQ